MRHFADGRGLARAVHADHEEDVWPRALLDREWLLERLEQACNFRGQHIAHSVGRQAALVPPLGDRTS